MGFYKDCGGLVMFILCHSVLIMGFFFIYFITDTIDDKENYILTIHKVINFIFLFLSIFCHIKTSLIDPGTIECSNNKEIIEFYNHVHTPLIKRAMLITEKKTPEVIKKIIFDSIKKSPPEKSDGGEEQTNNAYNEDNSEDDEVKFENKTSINEDLVKVIEGKYHMKVTRCRHCYVIRPIDSHHCGTCHKCILDQDHHCPWVNNCIGIFNKKIFLLFLFYGSISFIYTDILFFYYTMYKNGKSLQYHPLLLIFDVFTLIFGLILTVVGIMLLYDQYDTMVNDCIKCDYKEGILCEKSSIRQQFQLVFGGIFNFRWFLPFFSGGNYDFFLKMCKFLEERQFNKKKMNSENSGNEDGKKMNVAEKEDKPKNE